MRCGVCGGGVRGFRGTLHGRPIADWKHTDVPPGTEPHRPVLGTPVDEETLERLRRSLRPEEVVEEEPPPPLPLVLPRAATVEEVGLKKSSPRQMLGLLEENGWTLVEEPIYFQAVSAFEYLVVRARRRDLGMVVSWERRPGDTWSFEHGFEVAAKHFQQVGSKQLKTWVTQRDEECPECGASSAVHDDEECAS